MKKTRAKKFKVRKFYHLQNLFWGVFVQGVYARGGVVLIPCSADISHGMETNAETDKLSTLAFLLARDKHSKMLGQTQGPKNTPMPWEDQISDLRYYCSLCKLLYMLCRAIRKDCF